MKKLIFSDFDGVYHPWPKNIGMGVASRGIPGWEKKYGEKWVEFMYMPNLVEVLRKYDNWEIVLSTAWREPVPFFNKATNSTHWIAPEFDELRALFPADIAKNIIDVTPVLPNNTRRGGRYDEILEWLIGNDRTDSDWVALDDVAEYFPEYCPNLLLCDEERGLSHGSPALKMLDDFLSDKYTISK